MAKCPPGFKKKGTKCVRSTTYKSPLLRKKEQMASRKRTSKKFDDMSKSFAAVKKRQGG